ncbi:MAG: phosphoglucosamine mutase [Lysobacterales bacterium]
MRRYFGTDGIRGRVGSPTISADFAVRLGRAAGAVLGRGHQHPLVLIGKDTRISGYMFESAIEAGLSAAGADVVLLGPMPTPAVAYLTRHLGAQAGIVISASHNPYPDNGIKFFSAHGEKLPDEVELAIEAELDEPFSTVESVRLGKARRHEDGARQYLDFCLSTLRGDLPALRGQRIVVDAANGAAYRLAPRLLQELGADLHTIGVEPDGLNINQGCGATDLDALIQAVREQNAALGVALDGDGDRLMLVSASGRVIDGDDIIWLLAKRWQNQAMLRGPVVGTLMTNFGIEHALQQRGIGFERAAVGDRYVLERMKQRGGNLGGEASGHVLCLDRATTGDALVTLLAALEAVDGYCERLDESLADLQRVPQRTVNVPLRGSARSLLEHPQLTRLQEQTEAALTGRGRLVLRPSGTEPLLRVTVEGPDGDEVQHWSDRLAALARELDQSQP